jgi:hypothetical protein
MNGVKRDPKAAALHFAIRNLVAAQRNAREGLIRQDREFFLKLARANAETAIRSLDVLLPIPASAAEPARPLVTREVAVATDITFLSAENKNGFRKTSPSLFKRVAATLALCTPASIRHRLSIGRAQ